MSDEPTPPIADLLDDGTPPDRRRAAEAAASDPALAEEFRALSAVRDLVAGLSRPAPPDLAGVVLRRIAARRRFRLAARAAAAVLLVAGGLAGYSASRPRTPRTVAPPRLAPPVVAATPSPSPSPSPSHATIVPAPAVAAAPALASAREFVGPPDDRPLIARRLLERSGPVRVFLALDARPVDAAEVAALVGLSSHRDFHRFDLPAVEGRPGVAVFAAELDPGELRTLRMRLADEFPDGLLEQESGPLLLADVARAATATTLRGDPAAEFLMPRRELAIRIPRDEPAPAGAAPPRPATVPVADPDEAGGPCLVLIWLPAADG